jgi:hypothetical protein
MKQPLLLVGTFAFAVGLFISPQADIGSPVSQDDGRHRTAYAIDPITGRLLFVEDLEVLPSLPLSLIPTDNPLGIHLIATATLSKTIVSAPDGFDMDHDSAREFVIREDDGDIYTSTFEVWESTGDDTFHLAHTLDVAGDHVSCYPHDVGDADNDGLADLLAFGRDGNYFFIRLYESTSTDTYPTEAAWEVNDGPGWAVGAEIADTDRDGANEIVVAGQGFNYEQRIAIYENTGDNSFAQIFYVHIPDMDTSQSMEVADDLDGDGWDEILFGGLLPNRSMICVFEATSDDCYQHTWSGELPYHAGQLVNASFIRQAGDLDGDGKKEFLAGGLRTIPASGYPFFSVLYVFEAQSNDSFEVVASFILPRNVQLDSEADVADLDADGKKEIVFGSGNQVAVYQNTGDNQWTEVWTDVANIESLNAGDHDGDGAQEILFQQFGGTNIFEGILVDTDGDEVSNALDNCPFDANPPEDCDGNAGTPDEQCDLDADGIGDVCDSCPDDDANDVDLDRICAGSGYSPPMVGDGDNCPFDLNPDQADLDLDGIGNACDLDLDGDGVDNDLDNCPFIPDPDQSDTDLDSFGDACDCAPSNAQSWEIPSAIDSVVMTKADSCGHFACSESGGPCSSDTDCNFDICENFTCSASGNPCVSDAECDMDVCQGFACSFGGNSCNCYTDCTADFCDNMTCTVGDNSCTSDTDCTADYCDNMRCTITLVPCTSDGDCFGGLDDWCVGQCSVSGVDCSSDNDCVGDVCQGDCSIGANTCTDDDQCTADICEGQCSIGGNSCVVDDQCTADVCEGQCSIGGNTCTDDDQCTAPQTDLCQSVCTIGGNECSSDEDCTAFDIDTLFWHDPEDFGGTGVVYDTLRSLTSADFTTPATCVETDGLDRITSDGTVPTVGTVLYYLIRVENGCPEGNMGSSSSGPRTGKACE